MQHLMSEEEMSNLAMAWAMNLDLKAPMKPVLLALAWRLNEQRNQCDPSFSRLAIDTGLSARTVKRAVSEMEKVGVIRKQKRFSRFSNGAVSNRYELAGSCYDWESEKFYSLDHYPPAQWANEVGRVVSDLHTPDTSKDNICHPPSDKSALPQCHGGTQKGIEIEKKGNNILYKDSSSSGGVSVTLPEPATKSEKSQRKAKEKAAKAPLDFSSWIEAGASPESVASWKEHRKSMKAPVSPRVIKTHLEQFLLAQDLCGMSIDACIDKQLHRGWRAFEASWVANGTGGAQKLNTEQFSGLVEPKEGECVHLGRGVWLGPDGGHYSRPWTKAQLDVWQRDELLRKSREAEARTGRYFGAPEHSQLDYKNNDRDQDDDYEDDPNEVRFF